LIKRILVAIPALALLFCVVYFHGIYAKIFAGLLCVLCIHEMMKAAGTGEAKPIRPIGYAFAALLIPAFLFVGGFTGAMLLYAAAAMAVFIVLAVSGRDARDGLLTGLPMLYPGLLFVFFTAMVCVPEKEVSQFLIIIAFASTVITDSFAYFTGMLLGKHKLCPKISPKKTVEGAIGGTVFGTAAVVVFGIFAQGVFGVDIAFYWYIVLGLALSVLAQFGDLAASIIKRKFGVKDFGRIMAGHGGAMDRLDSVLFISPAVFAFYLIAAL